MGKMRSYKILIGLLMSVFLLTAMSAIGQTDTFSDANVDYSFTLPDARWKMTVKPSATNPEVEYVYGDRNDGHLEVRKLNVMKDMVLSDVLRKVEQQETFKRAFVAGKDEAFAGHLKGAIFNFEYVKDGKSMSGRFYFFRTNDTTVYVLRFLGPKDGLRGIRNQTDLIARTFVVK